MTSRPFTIRVSAEQMDEARWAGRDSWTDIEARVVRAAA